MFILISLFIILTILAILSTSTVIVLSVRSYKKYIQELEDVLEEYDSIVVLGAGVRPDGKPSDILADRLETAIKIYKNKKSKPIILSGDHGSDEYNEVGIMRDYVARHNIPKEEIFMDHAGFSTYDTIYRAKEIFKVERPIIVTNRYHLPRALYLARKLGLKAYGIESDIRKYQLMDKYLRREVLAQIKDFVYVNITKAKPKFLGEPIPIQTSDGKVTDDNK